MKNSKYIAFALLSIVLIACNKDKHEVVPPPHPNAAALEAFMQNNIENATQHFTVNANEIINVTGEKGTNLWLAADQLTYMDGTPVDGVVSIELIEVDKRSEMLLLNKTTNAVRPSGAPALLRSQGEYYINFKKNGEQLSSLSPVRVTNGLTADEYNPGMRKFVNTSDSEDMRWEIAEDSILSTEIDSSDAFDYLRELDLYPEEFGWINCDEWRDYVDSTGNFRVKFMEGFNFENVSLFIAFEGEVTMLANISGPLPGEDGISITEYDFTDGLSVHFIAISIIDGDLNYFFESTVIEEEHLLDLSPFTVVTEEELSETIDALP